jgi:hypothetical protein
VREGKELLVCPLPVRLNTDDLGHDNLVLVLLLLTEREGPADHGGERAPDEAADDCDQETVHDARLGQRQVPDGCEPCMETPRPTTRTRRRVRAG